MPHSTQLVVLIVDEGKEHRSFYKDSVAGLGFAPIFVNMDRPEVAQWIDFEPACLVINFATLSGLSAKHVSWVQELADRFAEDTISLGERPDWLTSTSAIEIREPISMSLLGRFINFISDRHLARLRFGQSCQDTEGKLSKLTERQREVLNASLEGLPMKAIASLLGYSQRTIEAERCHILRIFGADTIVNVALQIGEFRVLDALRNLSQLESFIKQQQVASFYDEDGQFIRLRGSLGAHGVIQ